MMEYKDESYFNSYFRDLTDFRLTKEFEKTGESYVGTIEPVGTIHPISIDVEIPASFPYRKLVFWTSSLSGYPHLINGTDPYLRQIVDSQRGWFCLNTPFAEMPEMQLQQELVRLRGWFERFLRDDLPAHITNPSVIKALSIANGFNWENQDEIQEVRHRYGLTFVGDFGRNPDNFKQKKGTLHCNRRTTRNGEFHIYAYQKKEYTDMEIPYTIVDSFCGADVLKSFFQLRNTFSWDAEEQERLLPNFNLQKKYEMDGGYFFFLHNYVDTIKQNRDRIVIDPEDAPAIDEAILKLEEEHAKCGNEETVNSRLALALPPSEDDPDYEKKMEEYAIQCAIDAQAEAEFESHMYDWHFFALGVMNEGQLDWVLFWTNRASKKFHNVNYKFGEYKAMLTRKDGSTHETERPITLTVKRFIDVEMNCYLADHVPYPKYFGRGGFKNLKDKKIAILGAGAIGSVLATSLVRGGVKQLGIWDGDTVEPGNLCRSAYRGREIGVNKASALAASLRELSPFCKISAYDKDYYPRINYESQEAVISELQDYDIVIDCTASTELLHFLSYAVADKLLISVCITNHAANLLFITNKEASPYETLKANLAKIEQDSDNYYVEGTGCFNPTFLASNSDVNALLNLAIRDFTRAIADDCKPSSIVYSYTERGIVAERMKVYSLSDDSIRLVVGSETLLDGEEMPDAADGKIGILYGSYSRDGHYIFLTHFGLKLDEDYVRKVSDNVLEYIGEFRYSDRSGSYTLAQQEEMQQISDDLRINTYNPMLAIRNTDGSLGFYLFIDGALEPFIRMQP